MNNDVFKEEISKLIKKQVVLYKGKAHLLCSLTFLLHCRHMGTILNIIKIRRVLTSDQAHRVYNRTEWIFLREFYMIHIFMYFYMIHIGNQKTIIKNSWLHIFKLTIMYEMRNGNPWIELPSTH